MPNHGFNASEPGPLLSVLIADAQALFAEALGVALDDYDGLQVVGERPGCGPTAIAAVCRHRPDVVVYDYWMLGLDGPAAIGEMLAAVPGTKVIVTSWFHSPDNIRAALDAGAAGFLPKSLGLAQVAEALRRVGAGEPLVFAEQLAGLVDDLDNRWDHAVSRAEKLLALLTPREREVLQALADGTPAAELAHQLSISVGTLKNHIHSILAKTGTRSQVEAIDLAREARFLSGRGLGPSREQLNGRTDGLCDVVYRAAHNDERSHAAEVARVVELLDGGRHGDAAVQRLLSLTPRELQVLQLLAKGSGIKEVAAALYLSAGTVKNLSHRLMRKLGVRTHPEAQAMARHAGFLC